LIDFDELRTLQNFTSIWGNTQFATVTEKTISEVRVSPGSADTLVRRSRETNQRSLARSVGNISAKNYQNWLMRVEVVMCNISVVF